MSHIVSPDLKQVLIPKIVFIVPYRSRPEQKLFFSNYIQIIMRDVNIHYEVYFSHQCDARSFNRGGTKNIGFLAIKQKYPDHYKNITFVFNDVDTLPFSNIFDYATTNGIVKHFYGFTFSLGGIVSIIGSDFEQVNGFPNYWGWGMEDNVFQKRCEKIGLKIDRSQFVQIGNPQVLQLFDGMKRLINKKDPWRAIHDDGIDGVRTIHKLQYNIANKSLNPLDNIHVIESDKIYVINITTFLTAIRFENDTYDSYDLRDRRKIINPNLIDSVKPLSTINDWTNKPHFKPNQEDIDKPDTVDDSQVIYGSNNFRYVKKSASVNKYTSVNKYAPEYAHIIGVKPKATTSAFIGLGGVGRR